MKKSKIQLGFVRNLIGHI